MALSTDAWVAQAQAALLEEDSPQHRRLEGAVGPYCLDCDEDWPCRALGGDAPPTWQEQHYAEYSRRLLAVYAACDGWSRAAVTPLWPWVEYSSVCFEAADADGWTAALAELERYCGVTAGGS